MERNPLRIVFILCASHSGGTLLSLLLGAHSQVCSVGAVHNLPKYAGSDSNRGRCTCGAHGLENCAFWSVVNRELERQGRSVTDLDINAKDPERFRTDNEMLFSAVARASGTNVIVDSSKGMGRYARLCEAGFAEVLAVYLLRSPYGRVNSVMRRKELTEGLRSTVSTMRKALRLTKGRPAVGLRYEELAERPRESLQRVMPALGLAFEEEQLDLEGREFHNLGGNHMRFSGVGEIRVDRKWRREMPWRRKLLVTLVTGPAYLWTLARMRLGMK